MRNLMIMMVAVLAIWSCKEEAKDYITFSGKITNKNSDSLVVLNPRVQYKKVIQLNEDGTFSDTLKVKDSYLSVFDGKDYVSLYAKNGDDIKMTFDAKNLNESLRFSGAGSEASNYLAKATLMQEELLGDNTIFKLERNAFKDKLDVFENDFVADLDKALLDSTFVADQKRNFKSLKGFIASMYDEKHYLATALSEGTTSPKFTDYENYAGGTTSLDDLKGKYVYIDLWATWCGPCKFEIPYLKKVEKEYHSKNITFVSISIDRKSAYEKWKNMVKDKELAGVQLYANEDERFVDAYKVSGIPRFILVDPQGKIVSSDAPRPSDPKLIQLFDDLKI